MLKKKFGKNLFLVFMTLFIVSMGDAITKPYLPILVEQLGGNMISLGFMTTVSTVFTVIFPLAIGIISDIKGRRILLILITGLEILSMILIVLSSYWLYMLPGILLMNFVLIVRKNPLNALIVSETNEVNRGSAFGALNSLQGIGKIIGPILAGIIVTQISIKSTFLIRVVLLFIALILTFKIREDSILINKNRGNGNVLTEFLNLFKKDSEIRNLIKPLHGLFAAEIIISFVNGIFSPFLAVYVKSTLKDVSKVGLYYSVMQVSFIVISSIAGKLTDKIGRKKMLIYNGISSFAACLCLFYAKSDVMFFFAFILWGIMLGFGGPAFDALIGDCIPSDKCGQVYGTFTTLTTLAIIPSPLIGGLLIESYGYHLPIIIACVGGVLYSYTILVLLRDDYKSHVIENDI